MPLLAADIPSGFRLGLTDTARAVLSSAEQPLSAHSLVGNWALIVAAVWFVLWLRGGRWWGAIVVTLAGATLLARTGNAWLSGLLMLAPLATHLHRAPWRWTPVVIGATVLVGLGVSAGLAFSERPRPMPASASAAARQTRPGGSVLTHWAWAPELQSDLGTARPVLAARGLFGESDEFWLDYLRVAQGHERWSSIVNDWHVDTLVLDAANQEAKAAALVRASPDWWVVFDADGTLVAERVRR
ncbi:MAG: hypothetical protein NVSMB2_20410 [Chloroflexota bacterium]